MDEIDEVLCRLDALPLEKRPHLLRLGDVTESTLP